MSRRRFFFYWLVVLVLAVIVLIVLLIASSRSTQALDSFPVRMLHGTLTPGFMLLVPLKEMYRERHFPRENAA